MRRHWNSEQRQEHSERMKKYYSEHPESTTKGYKESDEQKKRKSKRMKEISNREEVKNAFGIRMKEFWSRGEERKKQSERRKKYFSEHPEAKINVGKCIKEFYGNPETKKVLVKRIKEFSNRPEERKARSKRALARFSGMSLEDRKKYMLRARMATKPVSKAEIALYELIHQYYPTAKSSQWICGHQADIVISECKINIEYDGAYWHPMGNEKDKKRDEILRKAGWEIIRIRQKEEFSIKTIHELVNNREVVS